MAKAPTLSPREQAIFDLGCAIVSSLTIEDSIVETLKSLGRETDDVKQVAIAGYMFRRLQPGKKPTPALFASMWEVRNAPEHKALYTSARQYMKRLREAAGVEASDPRGGDRGPRQPVGGEDDTPPAPPAKRKYETEVDLRKQFAHMAATALKMADAHSDVCGMQTRKIIERWVKETAAWATPNA